MKSLYFIALLSSVLSPCVNASVAIQLNVSGFDKPEEVRKMSLGKSKYRTGENIKLSCYVYSEYVVLELDEGQKGASEFIVRPRSKRVDVNDLCKNESNSKSIVFKNVAGYFLGASGRYIFERSADGNGVLMGMTVYDAFSKQIMLDTEFNERSRKFLIERVKDKVSLTYYQRLKIRCFPKHQNDACWKTILKENGVDSNLKIEIPSCKAALNYAPDAAQSPESSLLITAKVWVDDLSKPKITYLGGDSTCDASP